MSFILTVLPELTLVTLKLSSATIIKGHEQVETISIKVKGEGTVVPTGTVMALYAPKAVLYTMTLSQGRANCKLSPRALAVGTYSVEASYPGNASFGASGGDNKTPKVVR